MILPQQTEVHESGREDVVEVMRHTAGQLSDGLHLLGLEELGFQALALGDVFQAEQHPGFVPRRTSEVQAWT